MRVVQEFYCNECHGYFRVTLNMSLNMNVEVECPNCQHIHNRCIKNGRLFDSYMGASQGVKTTDRIIAMRSTYSKTPALNKSRKHMRNGEVVDDPSKDLINERWAELYGDRV